MEFSCADASLMGARYVERWLGGTEEEGDRKGIGLSKGRI